jgi:predicted N-acyltransferase
VLARRDGRVIAGALNFEKGKHLYGRYWGAREEHAFLHFEVCYHQLIERAIANGCTRFEAGAQGSHKLKRGLLPSEVYNACHIASPHLARAVGDFLPREAMSVRAEMEALQDRGPSHREHDG